MNAPRRILDHPERLPLSVEHFMTLNEAGAFADYGKVELIDGDIYVMNAQYSTHARTKSRLHNALVVQLREIGSDLESIVEVAVRLDGNSMPEPDIVLTRWWGDGPIPVETIALAVEVAGTTLATDLGRKAQLYAAAGIPEYWVVDIAARRIVIHARSGAAGYAVEQQPIGGVVTSATVGGLAIDTGSLLP